MRCGIDRDDFLDALGGQHPALRHFIKTYRAKWIAVIGDVRHPAAHSALRLQRDIVAPTEDSKRSDPEIAAILREEDPEFYKYTPPELIKELEPIAISNWRMNKMKVITDDAIYVEKLEGGYYLRSPVTSLDFDLDMLNAFIDAFAVACFGQAPTVAGPLPPAV